MTNETIRKLLSPSADTDNNVWEIFHENSKVGRYSYPVLPESFIVSRMKEMYESLPYDEYPNFDLPRKLTPLNLSLDESILNRVTSRKMEPCELSIEDITTILHYSYGITRDNRDSKYSRAFRTVPSGGALYPLEIYFHARYVKNLDNGLYHYNPVKNSIQRLIDKDLTTDISKTLTTIQSNLAFDTSLMIFITAIFERETFKYGPRGYRFVFLEAGHVAQNINLTTTAMELGSVNICGYFDREVDELLGLDGIKHSTIYMIGIGRRLEE